MSQYDQQYQKEDGFLSGFGRGFTSDIDTYRALSAAIGGSLGADKYSKDTFKSIKEHEEEAPKNSTITGSVGEFVGSNFLDTVIALGLAAAPETGGVGLLASGAAYSFKKLLEMFGKKEAKEIIAKKAAKEIIAKKAAEELVEKGTKKMTRAALASKRLNNYFTMSAFAHGAGNNLKEDQEHGKDPRLGMALFSGATEGVASRLLFNKLLGGQAEDIGEAFKNRTVKTLAKAREGVPTVMHHARDAALFTGGLSAVAAMNRAISGNSPGVYEEAKGIALSSVIGGGLSLGTHYGAAGIGKLLGKKRQTKPNQDINKEPPSAGGGDDNTNTPNEPNEPNQPNEPNKDGEKAANPEDEVSTPIPEDETSATLETEADNTTPESETDNTTLETEANNPTPESETDNTTPESETNNTTPESETDNPTPESETPKAKAIRHKIGDDNPTVNNLIKDTVNNHVKDETKHLNEYLHNDGNVRKLAKFISLLPEDPSKSQIKKAIKGSGFEGSKGRSDFETLKAISKDVKDKFRKGVHEVHEPNKATEEANKKANKPATETTAEPAKETTAEPAKETTAEPAKETTAETPKKNLSYNEKIKSYKAQVKQHLANHPELRTELLRKSRLPEVNRLVKETPTDVSMDGFKDIYEKSNLKNKIGRELGHKELLGLKKAITGYRKVITDSLRETGNENKPVAPENPITRVEDRNRTTRENKPFAVSDPRSIQDGIYNKNRFTEYTAENRSFNKVHELALTDEIGYTQRKNITHGNTLHISDVNGKPKYNIPTKEEIKAATKNKLPIKLSFDEPKVRNKTTAFVKKQASHAMGVIDQVTKDLADLGYVNVRDKAQKEVYHSFASRNQTELDPLFKSVTFYPGEIYEKTKYKDSKGREKTSYAVRSAGYISNNGGKSYTKTAWSNPDRANRLLPNGSRQLSEGSRGVSEEPKPNWGRGRGIQEINRRDGLNNPPSRTRKEIHESLNKSFSSEKTQERFRQKLIRDALDTEDFGELTDLQKADLGNITEDTFNLYKNSYKNISDINTDPNMSKADKIKADLMGKAIQEAAKNIDLDFHTAVKKIKDKDIRAIEAKEAKTKGKLIDDINKKRILDENNLTTIERYEDYNKKRKDRLYPTKVMDKLGEQIEKAQSFYGANDDINILVDSADMPEEFFQEYLGKGDYTNEANDIVVHDKQLDTEEHVSNIKAHIGGASDKNYDMLDLYEDINKASFKTLKAYPNSSLTSFVDPITGEEIFYRKSGVSFTKITFDTVEEALAHAEKLKKENPYEKYDITTTEKALSESGITDDWMPNTNRTYSLVRYITPQEVSEFNLLKTHVDSTIAIAKKENFSNEKMLKRYNNTEKEIEAAIRIQKNNNVNMQNKAEAALFERIGDEKIDDIRSIDELKESLKEVREKRKLLKDKLKNSYVKFNNSEHGDLHINTAEIYELGKNLLKYTKKFNHIYPAAEVFEAGMSALMSKNNMLAQTIPDGLHITRSGQLTYARSRAREYHNSIAYDDTNMLINSVNFADENGITYNRHTGTFEMRPDVKIDFNKQPSLLRKYSHLASLYKVLIETKPLGIEKKNITLQEETKIKLAISDALKKKVELLKRELNKPAQTKIGDKNVKVSPNTRAAALKKEIKVEKARHEKLKQQIIPKIHELNNKIEVLDESHLEQRRALANKYKKQTIHKPTTEEILGDIVKNSPTDAIYKKLDKERTAGGGNLRKKVLQELSTRRRELSNRRLHEKEATAKIATLKDRLKWLKDRKEALRNSQETPAVLRKAKNAQVKYDNITKKINKLETRLRVNKTKLFAKRLTAEEIKTKTKDLSYKINTLKESRSKLDALRKKRNVGDISKKINDEIFEKETKLNKLSSFIESLHKDRRIKTVSEILDEIDKEKKLKEKTGRFNRENASGDGDLKNYILNELNKRSKEVTKQNRIANRNNTIAKNKALKLLEEKQKKQLEPINENKENYEKKILASNSVLDKLQTQSNTVEDFRRITNTSIETISEAIAMAEELPSSVIGRGNVSKESYPFNEYMLDMFKGSKIYNESDISYGRNNILLSQELHEEFEGLHSGSNEIKESSSELRTMRKMMTDFVEGDKIRGYHNVEERNDYAGGYGVDDKPSGMTAENPIYIANDGTVNETERVYDYEQNRTDRPVNYQTAPEIETYKEKDRWGKEHTKKRVIPNDRNQHLSILSQDITKDESRAFNRAMEEYRIKTDISVLNYEDYKTIAKDRKVKDPFGKNHYPIVNFEGGAYFTDELGKGYIILEQLKDPTPQQIAERKATFYHELAHALQDSISDQIIATELAISPRNMLSDAVFTPTATSNKELQERTKGIHFNNKAAQKRNNLREKLKARQESDLNTSTVICND